jgi:hypothetical protein
MLTLEGFVILLPATINLALAGEVAVSFGTAYAGYLSMVFSAGQAEWGRAGNPTDHVWK